MADPSLTALLDLQALDLHVDQLRHRRATLPERAEVAAAAAAVESLEEQAAPLRAQVEELRRRQQRFEDEVASLEAKQASENDRLYSGAVTSPKELQAIQEEIDGLRRRQRQVEDEELEVMEALEAPSAGLAAVEAEQSAHRAAMADAAGRLAAAEAEVDAELDALLAQREGRASVIPSTLLSTYERLRGRLGGIGAARLDGATCTGCHLALPAIELDAVRHAPADAVVTHEECGRILVRP